MPALIPCVGAVVRDDLGRLLLVRRGHEPGLGQWSIPGGRVEPGETAEQAVLRELAEETNLRGEVGQYLGSVLREAPGGGTYEIRDFLVRPAESPVPEPVAGDDAAAARWVSRGELGALPLVAGLVEALTEWQVLPD